MNERIRQLVEQARLITVDDTTRYASDDEFTEKFTELIVRECAEIALEQKKWIEDQKVHNPHDEVWNKARIQQSQHIVDKIKEHFGVEL